MSTTSTLSRGNQLWEFSFITERSARLSLRKKVTMHQVTTMPATSEKSNFQVITTTGADDPTL